MGGGALVSIESCHPLGAILRTLRWEPGSTWCTHRHNTHRILVIQIATTQSGGAVSVRGQARTISLHKPNAPSKGDDFFFVRNKTMKMGGCDFGFRRCLQARGAQTALDMMQAVAVNRKCPTYTLLTTMPTGPPLHHHHHHHHHCQYHRHWHWRQLEHWQAPRPAPAKTLAASPCTRGCTR